MTPLKISATVAKLRFGSLMDQIKDGKPVIIEKNNSPKIVLISIDDYEDYLESKDNIFQEGIEKNYTEIKSGDHGSMDNLYKIHRDTIQKEAEQ